MGIHYDYKSTRGEKALKKEAKRKARIEERRAKKKKRAASDWCGIVYWTRYMSSGLAEDTGSAAVVCNDPSATVESTITFLMEKTDMGAPTSLVDDFCMYAGDRVVRRDVRMAELDPEAPLTVHNLRTPAAARWRAAKLAQCTASGARYALRRWSVLCSVRTAKARERKSAATFASPGRWARTSGE